MTGQGCSYGWACESISPPTGEPGPANQPAVEVLGWHGYTGSAVVWPGKSTAKFSKVTLEASYALEIIWQLLCWTFL